jgi:hypothetical protein
MSILGSESADMVRHQLNFGKRYSKGRQSTNEGDSQINLLQDSNCFLRLSELIEVYICRFNKGYLYPTVTPTVPIRLTATDRIIAPRCCIY